MCNYYLIIDIRYYIQTKDQSGYIWETLKSVSKTTSISHQTNISIIFVENNSN